MLLEPHLLKGHTEAIRKLIKEGKLKQASNIAATVDYKLKLGLIDSFSEREMLEFQDYQLVIKAIQSKDSSLLK